MGERDTRGPGRRAVLAAGVGGVVAAVTAGVAAAAAGGGDGGAAGSRTPEAAAPQPSTTATPSPADGPRPLYLGTYTTSAAQGIGLAAYDPATGAITGGGTLAGVANPSWLAVSGNRLYAVDEQSDGAVTAIALPAGDGAPTVLGTQPTGGSGPCHLSVTPDGGHVLSANYDSGSVAVHPVGADGGLLPRTDLVQHTGSGPDPDRQGGPHAHMVLSDPAGRYVLAVDLGTDSVYTYRLDTATGKLAAVSRAAVTPGSGPRHLAFHPSGRFAYLANELGDSVIVCGYDQDSGTVTPGAPQPTVPSGSTPGERNYPAEVVVSPDGAFVYVSNRGHNSVARFGVSDDGGTLTLVDAVATGGAYPRDIAFGADGALLFAANQNGGSVTVFHRDASTGALAPTGAPFSAPTPVCVLPT